MIYNLRYCRLRLFVYGWLIPMLISWILRDLSEISRRGWGGGNRGRVTTFWDSKEGGVMKNGPLKGGGSCKCMPVLGSTQKFRRVDWTINLSLIAKFLVLGSIGDHWSWTVKTEHKISKMTNKPKENLNKPKATLKSENYLHSVRCNRWEIQTFAL